MAINTATLFQSRLFSHAFSVAPSQSRLLSHANGHAALLLARNQLLGTAAQSKVLAGVRPDGLEDAPHDGLVVLPRPGDVDGDSDDASAAHPDILGASGAKRKIFDAILSCLRLLVVQACRAKP